MNRTKLSAQENADLDKLRADVSVQKTKAQLKNLLESSKNQTLISKVDEQVKGMSQLAGIVGSSSASSSTTPSSLGSTHKIETD